MRVSFQIARAFALMAVALLSLASALPAQFRGTDEPFRSERTAAQQTVPSFRSDVRLVPLLATVKDANGALIGDLTKEEFEIFDNGVAQRGQYGRILLPS